MIDSWNYDPSQRSNNKRCNLRWLVTVLSYQLSLIARYHGPQPPAAPARLSSLLSELLGPVSGLWLEKIMKAGVEWLLTTATGSPGWAQSSHYDWERAAILLRTFNYLAQSHIRNRNVYLHKTENNVNHVSFVCLRISTIFAKKCPKKLSMIMRYIFGQHQHGQFGNITHPPRHCYWGTRVASVTCLFLSRHVSWQCRGKSHFNNMILSGNLCVVVSGWHWTVLCMMLCVVVFIGQ